MMAHLLLHVTIEHHLLMLLLLLVLLLLLHKTLLQVGWHIWRHSGSSLLSRHLRTLW